MARRQRETICHVVSSLLNGSQIGLRASGIMFCEEGQWWAWPAWAVACQGMAMWIRRNPLRDEKGSHAYTGSMGVGRHSPDYGSNYNSHSVTIAGAMESRRTWDRCASWSFQSYLRGERSIGSRDNVNSIVTSFDDSPVQS